VPVKYRVKITRSAEIDIDEIWSFIAEDSAKEAGGFILELEKQIDTLEHFPERCPLIPENEPLGTKYRHLLYGSYRTIFRISEDSVYGCGSFTAPGAGHFFLRIVAIRALDLR
jgi:toxin ParE1/3/4